jgi:hypothetical protein
LRLKFACAMFLAGKGRVPPESGDSRRAEGGFRDGTKQGSGEYG